MLFDLDSPISYLKGVGPKRARMFTEAGICSVDDFLEYWPFRYENRTSFQKIDSLELGELALIRCHVESLQRKTTSGKGISILTVRVSDESGFLLLKFFNQSYLSRIFRKGQSLIVYGVPRLDGYSSLISMTGPECEILDGSARIEVHTGRIVPVYRRIGSMGTRVLRQLLFSLLSNLSDRVRDQLPLNLLLKFNFPDFRTALWEVHFPEVPPGTSSLSYLKKLKDRRTSSHQRLIFEEFFFFNLALQTAKARHKTISKKRVISSSKEIEKSIRSIFPFQLTQAQQRVLEEITGDLCGRKRMNRLLQGDVGSGKTVVALQAMMLVMENGYQTVLMVPTEVLAEQHYVNIDRYLGGTKYRLGFLSGSVKRKQRSETLDRLLLGKIDLLVGTHSLIQESVQFKNLGFVVIDEQHRFGVAHRSRLMQKGDSPETLVMTATPIPRSMALTCYGDLDLSKIDEMPPGRYPVRTIRRDTKSRDEVYDIIAGELEKGRQAFVVYPIVEESEKVDLYSAVKMAVHLQNRVFPSYGVGLIHGRLAPIERMDVMQRFQKREIHLLVATTVIEVGVDVPNATVMVIENAERFGLSQLHQLRGRVGRGDFAGLCVLVSDRHHSAESEERLKIICDTQDGFKIAEKDLEIRGSGQFTGTSQTGKAGFSLGCPAVNRELLQLAGREAELFLSEVLESERGSLEDLQSLFPQISEEAFELYQVR